MNIEHLIDVFELESSALDATLRHHPALRPLFSRDFEGVDADALKSAYLQLLKMTADFVQYTVPALRAAGEVLREGDAEDRLWSELFLDYADGETDAGYGHHVWAHDDMKALDAPPELLEAPPSVHAVLYHKYFIEDVAQHPYAILGAKGVLEHFSIRVCDDMVRGVVESGIANAKNAVQLFQHHGVIDIDHVREGDSNLENLAHIFKRCQIVEGAYFTGGTYRSLARRICL